MKILLFLLVSFVYAKDCRYEYRSTSEPLKTFLDDFLIEHIGFNYTSSDEILLKETPITLEGCFKKSNFLSAVKTLFSPKGIKIIKTNDFIVLTSEKDSLFKQYHTTQTVKSLESELYPKMNLDYLNHWYDRANELIVIRDTQKNLSLFNKHLQLLKQRATISLEMNLHEVVVDSRRSEGFKVDGFLKTSFIDYNNVSLGRLMSFYYESDSSVFESRLLNSQVLKTKSNQKLSFFTGQEIEVQETFNSDGVVSSKTAYKDIGFNINFKPVIKNDSIVTCYFEFLNSSTSSTGDLLKFQTSQVIDLKIGQLNHINISNIKKEDSQFSSNPILWFLTSFFNYNSIRNTNKLQMISVRLKSIK